MFFEVSLMSINSPGAGATLKKNRKYNIIYKSLNWTLKKLCLSEPVVYINATVFYIILVITYLNW
jgi:hypothetical protein